MIKKEEWTRSCPVCGIKLNYKSNGHLKRAIKCNSYCKTCCILKIKAARKMQIITDEHKKSISNSLLGKTRPEYVCEKIRIANIGKKHSEETKSKISKSKKGIPQTPEQIEARRKGLIGRKISDETKNKIRKSYSRYLQNCGGKDGWQPTYNKSSIPILEQKAKELGITDLQHAENGGEFYIEKLGYWVDGYSKEKNIVIEYYESFHKNKVERDLKRQMEIENYLNCEFIIIYE